MKNTISYILFSYFLLIATFVQGLNPTEANNIFKQANKEYSNKNYAEAVRLYNLLLEENYNNPEILYNLGNAYYKNDDLTNAILHYEKAIKLKPSFEDAHFNLKIAYSKTIDKIDPLPDLFINKYYNNLIKSLTPDQWATNTIIMLFVALASIIIYLLSSHLFLKKIGFYGCIVFVFIGFTCWFMASKHNKLKQNNLEAIIFSSSITIMSEPNNSSEKLFTLHEGTKVKLIEQIDDWSKIKLPNGNIGWITSNSIEEI